MAAFRRYDVLAVVAVVLGAAGYASVHSEYRLRAEMPVEFFDASTVAPAKRAAEEKIAKAYWKCAVAQVQWKYGYAHRLPEEPPAEFALEPAEAGSAACRPDVRTRYWLRLRSAWGVSDLWEKQYVWNTISLRDSLRSAGEWLELQMRRILSYS